jgi:hypothetical protein
VIAIQPLPAAIELCEGENAAIRVSATIIKKYTDMGCYLKYQWRLNGIALDVDGHYEGTNTAELKINNVNSSDAGDYDCMITATKDKHPEIISEVSTKAAVRIKMKPVITIQPDAAVNVQQGKDLKLVVEADGEPTLQYAWFKDGVPTGDSTNTLTKAAVTSAAEGKYHCKVWNDCGEEHSKEADVTVSTYIMSAAEETRAGDFILLANVPNPFANTTEIKVVAPRAGYIRLTVTDIYGKEVAVIHEGMVDGERQFKFSAPANNLSSGVYYYTLTVDGSKATRQMTVVR